MKKFFTNKWYVLLLIGFLLIFTVFTIGSALQQSLTFDEVVYFQDGREMLLHHDFSLDPYNPPLTKELASLPYLLVKNFYNDPLFSIHYSLAGKIVSIVFGIGILLTVYFLVKKYFSIIEALVAVFLLVLEPTFLANAQLITPDISLTFFFFVSFSLFLHVSKNSSFKTFILLGICIGFGMVSKLPFLPFFLVSIFFTGVYLFRKKLFYKILTHKRDIFFVFMLTLLIAWITYFFTLSPVIKHRQDNSRVSQKISKFAMQHHVPFLAEAVKIGQNQSVPLGNFLAIIKNTLLRKPPTQCFFLGKYYASCLPYFLPINLFLKIPLPLFIFFSVSLVILALKKQERKKTAFIFIPMFCIVIITSFSRMQPLVRYALPAYPFLAIASASTWKFWQKNLPRQLVFAGLLIWYIGSTFTTFPYFLSFANEFAGYPQERFQLLTDSNLDWGQSLPAVARFIKNEKAKAVQFSYFGRDNGDWYGLDSNKLYMSYKNPEICEFHTLQMNNPKGKTYTLISSSNWYSCGYVDQKQFAKNRIQGILGDTILVF